jgi:hypothetical protein
VCYYSCSEVVHDVGRDLVCLNLMMLALGPQETTLKRLQLLTHSATLR